MIRALIVGGGIAGTVAAMALHKAGIESVVHEAYPTGADDVGAFLTVMNNGLDALRAIDAHEPVLAASFPAEAIEFFSGTGRRLGAMPIGGAGETGPRTLTRASLYRVLQDEAAGRGIRVEHGRRLTGATTGPDGRVTATFADGSTADGDLLVGADGVRSVTRTIVDAAAPRPRHLGLTAVCGYDSDSPVTTAPGTYRMVYGRRAFFGMTTAPTGHTWWFASVPGPELSAAALADTTAAQWRERTREAFAGDRAPVADVVAAADLDVVASNAYEIHSTPTWHAGSVVVIGDAAHAASPSAGHGASMAAEDAVTLARCLRDLPTVGQAFAAYERLRRERVERVVATSARMSGRATPGPVQRIVRDLMLPRLLRKGPRNTADWLTGHHIDWAAPVTS